MPKMRVERTTDYRLRAMIRGEMSAQGVTIEVASRYAGCSEKTLYRVFEQPTAYFDKVLPLMRKLSVPIERVRETICYPY